MEVKRTDSLGFEILNKISMDEEKSKIIEFEKNNLIEDKENIIFYNVDSDKYFSLNKDKYQRWIKEYKIEGVEI